MDELSPVDLALLSFVGINGRARECLGTAKLEELVAASHRRSTSIDLQKLREKHQLAEKYRLPLTEFISRGGCIAGPDKVSGFMRAPVPPLCAYVRGDPSLLSASTRVAIVGTRNPSPRGVARASELAAGLSEAGVLVVSGGATGIDLAAHKGAIESGHPTLAILGEVLKPLGDERPRRLTSLDRDHKLTTATVFGPWVRPSKSLFVIRNQYVAALSDAVVIIEGRPNSGTLHTARYAKQMGVPVWVIPGDPSDELSQAGNWLLEQGLARALVRLDYFLSTLKGGFAAPKAPKKAEQLALVPPRKVETRPELSGPQNEVLKLIEQNQGRMTVDELAEKCDTKLNALQQELLMLELMGVIHKQGTEFVVT